MSKCKACNGTGVFEYEDGDHLHEVECDKCNGTGVEKSPINGSGPKE